MYRVGAIAALIFFVELFLKTYLRQRWAGVSIPVVDNILHITVVFNSGAAFGILQQQTTLLIVIGLIFIVIFALFIKSETSPNTLFFIACGLIAGGALSNLFDRIFLGYVVDYIDIRVWPVFNIADSAITCGIGLLFWQTLQKRKLKT